MPGFIGLVRRTTFGQTIERESGPGLRIRHEFDFGAGDCLAILVRDRAAYPCRCFEPQDTASSGHDRKVLRARLLAEHGDQHEGAKVGWLEAKAATVVRCRFDFGQAVIPERVPDEAGQFRMHAPAQDDFGIGHGLAVGQALHLAGDSAQRLLLAHLHGFLGAMAGAKKQEGNARGKGSRHRELLSSC